MTQNVLLNADSLAMSGHVPNHFGDKPINCVVTDPPYGVNYRSRHATTPEGLRWVKDVKNDLDLTGALGLFQDVMDQTLPMTADQAELYVFTRWDIVGDWIDAVRAHLLDMAGDESAARKAYQQAARKTTSVPEQRYLLARAAHVGQPDRA